MEVRHLIVYNRKIEKKDILSLKGSEELIFYKDNNIAFTINNDGIVKALEYYGLL